MVQGSLTRKFLNVVSGANVPIRTFSPKTTFPPLKVFSGGQVPTTDLFLATSREKVPSTTFSPVTTFPSQTGGKVPTRHLSRPRRGANQAFFPLEGKIQNRKKKVSTLLPLLESSRRERHFYRIARIRSEWDLILTFFLWTIFICKWVGSFGPQVVVTCPKGKNGHAFSSLGPPVSGNRTQLCVFLTSMHALKISPRSKTPFVAPLGSKSQLWPLVADTRLVCICPYLER